MTLDEIARIYRWSPVHDYGSANSVEGRLVSIYGLGIWQADLESLRSQIPNLRVLEKGHVDHHEGRWLRVDLHEER